MLGLTSKMQLCDVHVTVCRVSALTGCPSDAQLLGWQCVAT